MNSSLPVPQEVREAMQQALDALERHVGAGGEMPTRLALRAALLHAQRVAPISDERIEAIAGTDELTGDAILRFARALLAEAVHPSPAPQARTLSDFVRNATPEEKEMVYSDALDKAMDRQRKTIAQAEAAVPVAIPEGWQLVPIEPTMKMCLADWNVSMSDAHTDGGVSECVWAAMLAAAPQQPAALSAAPAEGVRKLTDLEMSQAINASWRYEDASPFPVCRSVEALFLYVNAGKTIPATGMAATNKPVTEGGNA